MNTISEILNSQFSNQGVQDLRVFYDSLLFNLKVKNGTEYNNILLLEKIAFDYSNGSIYRFKNPIQINFGDTGFALPHISNGNCFVDAILDRSNNTVLIIGLKRMLSGTTIPVVYQYNINSHSLESIFPKTEDIDAFKDFNNYTFKSDSLPIAKMVDGKLSIIFQSQDLTTNYVNKLELDLNPIKLSTYEIFKYAKDTDINFTGVAKNFLNFKTGDYHGVLIKLQNGETVDNPSILALDDSFSILALDGTSVLKLDQ